MNTISKNHNINKIKTILTLLFFFCLFLDLYAKNLTFNANLQFEVYGGQTTEDIYPSTVKMSNNFKEESLQVEISATLAATFVDEPVLFHEKFFFPFYSTTTETTDSTLTLLNAKNQGMSLRKGICDLEGARFLLQTFIDKATECENLDSLLNDERYSTSFIMAKALFDIELEKNKNGDVDIIIFDNDFYDSFKLTDITINDEKKTNNEIYDFLYNFMTQSTVPSKCDKSLASIINFPLGIDWADNWQNPIEDFIQNASIHYGVYEDHYDVTFNKPKMDLCSEKVKSIRIDKGTKRGGLSFDKYIKGTSYSVFLYTPKQYKIEQKQTWIPWWKKISIDDCKWNNKSAYAYFMKIIGELNALGWQMTRKNSKLYECRKDNRIVELSFSHIQDKDICDFYSIELYISNYLDDDLYVAVD